MARLLGMSARIHQGEKYYDLAASDLEGAIRIAEHSLGPDNPNLVGYLRAYAGALRDSKRRAEAERVEARAKALLSERRPGP
jgi:hypothetical protein